MNSIVLEIGGLVSRPLQLRLADLERYPAWTVATSFLNDDKMVRGEYTGVRVWDLLAAAGANHAGAGDADAAGANHADADAAGADGAKQPPRIEARAGDGFRCLLLWDELDPAQCADDFAVLVALRQNGQPLAPEYGPLRLIVPGDVRGRRHLCGLAALTVLAPLAPPATEA